MATKAYMIDVFIHRKENIVFHYLPSDIMSDGRGKVARGAQQVAR